MTKARGLAALVLAVILLGTSCAGSGDPVRATLDAMVKASNARDAKALFSRVSPTFQAADGSGLPDARAAVDRYFAAYEILNVSIRDLKIERGEGAARVRLRAEMAGQPRKIGGLEGLVPSSAAYDFDLRLISEGGSWKVAWAQWNPAGIPAP